MSSTRDQIMDAMDAVEALSARLATLPVTGMSRAEAQAALMRLGRLREQLQEVERRLTGRLVASGSPSQFGARTWADVLAQRLRISPGEAQRRIAEAVSEGPSAA
ncbi:DUF222 domain-containing protein [Mycolicibacterium monacense]|nr:DUF222 domain-containing protein [Mycolicibacterium monacense]OBB68198.1 hypothetical protein A6B34_20370 [Mycolicibacterium monacense]OBF55187.1 hypothetical protein A5778_00445 [Mycolicibacterium monacense]ORB17514.1 hypothetical protein BST34_18055 [Mycolicibacterium monacense DSM 44395]QHP88796.1 DUF222 domain-containing protein [Mycolicibacterium monacense DSM 44395]